MQKDDAEKIPIHIQKIRSAIPKINGNIANPGAGNRAAQLIENSISLFSINSDISQATQPEAR